MLSRVVFVLLFATAMPAMAQTRTASGEDLARAQSLVNAATQSYQAGEFAAALSALKKAEAIAARADEASLASIRFNIARCLEQLGRAEEALEAYRRYDQLPDAQHRKQKAFEAMQALEQRVFAVLSVSCAPAGAVVEIPGLTSGARPCPWQSAKVRPGAYAISVEAPGHAPQVRSVTVKAGTAENVQFALSPNVSSAPPSVVGTAPPPPGRGLDPLPLLVLGGGVLVAGVGGVFTGLALNERDAAEEALPGPAQDGAVSNFETYRTLSYVLYGVGGAAAATGVVLFFLPGSEDDPAAARLVPGPTGFTVKF